MKYQSEYHTDKLLNQIATWDMHNIHQLVANLVELWEYKKYTKLNWTYENKRCYDKKPTYERKHAILNLELHTGGWSGNEDIIQALQNNKLFWVNWEMSRVGGHYYFKIDFNKYGFMLVSEFCKKNNVSRQHVYNYKHKFEWVDISSKKKLIR